MDKLPHPYTLLISYSFLQRDPKSRAMVEALSDTVMFLIDSGAFSAWANKMKRLTGKHVANEDVQLEPYIQYCRDKLDGRVWQYIMLDVPRDTEASAANWNKMLNAGLKPMPVMVLGWGKDEAREFAATNTHICVAGMVLSARGYAARRVQETYESTGAQIHALGYGRWPDIFRLPMFSADSSAIQNGQKWGWLCRYERKYGVEFFRVQAGMEGLSRAKRDAAVRVITELTENWGVTREQVLDIRNSRGGISLSRATTAYAYLNFTADVWRSGRVYFPAHPTESSLLITWGVISAMKAGGKVNYRETVEAIKELQDLRKRNFGQYLATVRAILRKKTDFTAQALCQCEQCQGWVNYAKNSAGND